MVMTETLAPLERPKKRLKVASEIPFGPCENFSRVGIIGYQYMPSPHRGIEDAEIALREAVVALERSSTQAANEAREQLALAEAQIEANIIASEEEAVVQIKKSVRLYLKAVAYATGFVALSSAAVAVSIQLYIAGLYLYVIPAAFAATIFAAAALARYVSSNEAYKILSRDLVQGG